MKTNGIKISIDGFLLILCVYYGDKLGNFRMPTKLTEMSIQELIDILKDEKTTAQRKDNIIVKILIPRLERIRECLHVEKLLIHLKGFNKTFINSKESKKALSALFSLEHNEIKRLDAVSKKIDRVIKNFKRR